MEPNEFHPEQFFYGDHIDLLGKVHLHLTTAAVSHSTILLIHPHAHHIYFRLHIHQ